MPIDLEALLESSGAVLRGHFILTSGRHSDVYFEKFRVLERPDVLSALCAEIASHYSATDFDFVAGPTTGGIIIAFEVGRLMGLPTRYVESVDGVKQLRRNASVEPGSRVLLVDDVMTTGLSLREASDALEALGAKVTGIAVLIDRSEKFEPWAPFFASYRVNSTSYAADAVPEWLAKVPAVKPGTRAAK
jgi:orotate phosphoribosyltransferase